MRKQLYTLLFLLALFASCEDVYYPDIDTIDGQLVVDAIITNDLSQNYVHLTRTRSFYSRQPLVGVSGATVDLVELGGKAIRGTESSTGFYTFKSIPVTGKKYFIRIVIQGETYESAAVTMPPAPTMADFYTEHVVKRIYKINQNGVPQPFDVQMREMYADLPLTDSLSHYRFIVKSTIEWTWNFYPNIPSVIPTAYGWYSYRDKERFNIAGPKSNIQPQEILKHPLLAISYDPLDYLFSDTLAYKGWIIDIEQYGTSRESYEFHDNLNSQFAAEGSLFDPVETQVHGNILCKTDPTKTVYGYFDLNSYRKYRYYFNLVPPPGAITLREVFRYPPIPEGDGMILTEPPNSPWPPDWWEL